MKKIFGIVLILIAVILSISMIFQIGGVIKSFIEAVNKNSKPFRLEYFSGQVIGVVLFVLLVYFLFCWGFKLIKVSIQGKKPANSWNPTSKENFNSSTLSVYNSSLLVLKSHAEWCTVSISMRCSFFTLYIIYLPSINCRKSFLEYSGTILP